MITTEDKSALKQRLVEECITRQEMLIEDFRSRIKGLLESGPLGNEEEYDNSVLAQHAQSTAEIDSLNDALKFATDELNELIRLQAFVNRPVLLVSPGAVVVTDRATFFISVSIEQFEVDGEPFVGLSEKSPLYSSMKGKKKGQKFSYNGTGYKITDIF